MKIATLILSFLASACLACDFSEFNACRDSYTKSISPKKAAKARASIESFAPLAMEIRDAILKANKRSTHTDLFKDLLKIKYLKEDYHSCLSRNWFRSKDGRNRHCVKKTVEEPIYFAFSKGYLDATAAIILLSKIDKPKTAAVTGRFGAYAHKIDLLRKSYIKNQGSYDDEANSPLSKKKYLEKLGKLKNLTPRQRTLLRYNYTQMKIMGEILVEFDKRVQAVSSGIFYDYDGDGAPDDNVFFDPAEQYRATVKLLKQRLEKESRTGGPFHGQKPTFHDLLVAGNELGLISDQDLSAMMELPYLYEEETPLWKKAGDIAWEVGKGVVMAVPGINLYAIIPIVLVESYMDKKEREDETSDLHLFTF